MTTPAPDAAVNRRPVSWPVVSGILLFPALKYGMALRAGNPLLALAAGAIAYLLCIYLYRGVMSLVYFQGSKRLLVITLGAIVVAGLVSPTDQIFMGLANSAMIPVAAILAGRSLVKDGRLLRAYLIGTGIVVAGGLIMYLPEWGRFMAGFRLIGEQNIASFKQSLTALGYHADSAEAYGAQLQRFWNALTRITPAMSIMSLVTQFSVGFLWFLARGIPTGSATGGLRPFRRWKVPFALTPLLITAALGRLFGNEFVTLVSDNVLLVVSIYYCVGGLALVEHVLRKLRLPLVIRILFYVMLTLMGVIGYFLTVLLGFIDSFADWRKVNHASIGLEKN